MHCTLCTTAAEYPETSIIFLETEGESKRGFGGKNFPCIQLCSCIVSFSVYNFSSILSTCWPVAGKFWKNSKSSSLCNFSLPCSGMLVNRGASFELQYCCNRWSSQLPHHERSNLNGCMNTCESGASCILAPGIRRTYDF